MQDHAKGEQPVISDKLKDEYLILNSAFGFVQLPPRTLLKAQGADAAKFLHSFCTADVNSMKIGDVREAFMLDSRGKTLAFGHILRNEDTYFYSVPSKRISSQLLQHLDQYIIREDVKITDESDLLENIFVGGDESYTAMAEAFGVTKDCVMAFEVDGTILTAAHADFAGSGFLLLFDKNQLAGITEKLQQLGAVECSTAALELVRLESGCPWYGREIDETNLPQEVRRDERAISFTKGCYLGQETVAKIDAIGHVNRFMIGLSIAADSQVAPNAEVSFEGAKAGEVKSSTFSPELSRQIALAYVKRKYAEPGTEVRVGESVARVIELPIKKAAT